MSRHMEIGRRIPIDRSMARHDTRGVQCLRFTGLHFAEGLGIGAKYSSDLTAGIDPVAV